MIKGPFRAGPWPGLTVSGAVVLLACGALLGLGQLALAAPRGAWPDLTLVGVGALVPLVIATRVVGAPGAATAACGAFLLPRAVISLVDASIEPPPLLLVPALGFEVCAWLRPRSRRPRRIGLRRGVLAGAVYGLVWSLVEPPYAVFLGADATAWSPPELWLASAACVAGCATIGSAVRGTGS